MHEEGKLFLKSYLFDDTVKIEIKDTGRGVPDDMIRDIFNPFFTTKSTGLGLGLTICKQILSYHNGTIDVESKLNEGTIFTLSFPAGKN